MCHLVHLQKKKNALAPKTDSKLPAPCRLRRLTFAPEDLFVLKFCHSQQLEQPLMWTTRLQIARTDYERGRLGKGHTVSSARLYGSVVARNNNISEFAHLETVIHRRVQRRQRSTHMCQTLPLNSNESVIREIYNSVMPRCTIALHLRQTNKAGQRAHTHPKDDVH